MLAPVREAERDERIEEVMDSVNLTDRADTFIGHLSKGYRQRVGLAQAILHNPDGSVRERLDRLSAEREQERLTLYERLLAIAQDSAKHFSDEDRAFDYDAWLYDEDGLPK